MKTLLVFFSAAFLTVAVSAMNIVLKNGMIYPNAVVMNSDNNGIWIQCNNNDGTFFQRHISYSALSTASYNIIQPLTGNNTNQSMFSIRQRFGQIAQMEQQQAETNPTGGNYSNPSFTNVPGQPIILPGVASQINLNSIKVYGNGTIGWANSDPDFSDNVNYGRIFVYGIQIPQLGIWAGNVYPTNKTINYRNWTLPCFTTTPGDAQNINAQEW